MNFKAMRYGSTIFNRNVTDKSHRVKPELHDIICLTNSFVFTQALFLSLKPMGFESASLNRVLADKSHHVTLAYKPKQVCRSSSHWSIQHFSIQKTT